jgi:hypothetical protein
VNIRLDVAGWLALHDEIDLGDVQATEIEGKQQADRMTSKQSKCQEESRNNKGGSPGGDVSGDQATELALAKALQCHLALLLHNVAMQRLSALPIMNTMALGIELRERERERERERHTHTRGVTAAHMMATNKSHGDGPASAGHSAQVRWPPA